MAEPNVQVEGGPLRGQLRLNEVIRWGPNLIGLEAF